MIILERVKMKDNKPKHKVFCVAPFVHMWYRNSGSYYILKPCCEVLDKDVYYIDKSKEHKDNIIADYWNSDYIKDMRKSMLENKPHKFCEECFKIEKEIGWRHRDAYTGYLNDPTVQFNIETGNEFNQPITLDYRPSNLCNLKCRMCGPGSSSEWAKEIDRFKKSHYENLDKMSDNTEVFMMATDNSYMFDKESNPDDQYKNLPLDKIRRANFLGGEPLLNQEVYDVMSHWIDIGKNDVRISITTNGTSFTNKWMELFSKFKKINLVISLDGVEDVFEYVRTNANWKKVIENCKKVEQLETVNITFSYCIQMYNAFDLTNILNFVKHWNISNDIIFERVHQNFLCTTLLTENDYNKIISDLDMYKKLESNSSKWVDEIINILKYDRTRIITEAERTYFKDYTNRIDQARNTKLTDLSPEFKKYLI